MANALIPFFLMVLVQLGFAVMNIISKFALQTGSNPFVIVAYRQIFAFVSIAPFAYWLEWKTLPKITRRFMLQILFSSLTGVANQILYFVGLQYSTATIACVLTNLLPAFTFVLALIFRQEHLRIKKKDGQAKVLGTSLCVSGAVLLSLYHGKAIDLGNLTIHWRYANKMEGSSSSVKTNFLLGPLALIASTFIWAAWFIIQGEISKKFPAPYTSTSIMCLLASFQCVAIALCFDHKASAWSLRDPTRLLTALYVGIVCTGLANCLMSWTIERKGPLYVSVFSPLELVLTAILSCALLQEKLYVGTVLGSLLIVVGLYIVLWGKSKEVNEKDATEVAVREEIKENDEKDSKTLELHSY